MKRYAKKNNTDRYEWDKIADDAWYVSWYAAIDGISDPTNPVKNTSLHKAAVPFKSPVRLSIGRADRVYNNIHKAATGQKASFLPSWFKYVSPENIIELTADSIIVARTMIKGQRQPKHINFEYTSNQQEEIAALEKKASEVSSWQRFKAVMFKGGRPTRLANAILWATINLGGIILVALFLASVPVTLPFIGAVATLAALEAALAAVTFGGTFIDIIIDMFGSLYELFNLSSLLGKITEKDPDKDNFLNKNVLHYVNTDLQLKRHESLVTRHLRLFGYNATLCLAMGLIVFTPTLPLGLLILGACALYTLVADVIPTLKLANNKNNTIDKVRALVALSLLLAAIGLGVAMALGAPFTILMIGAVVALTIGITGLGRRIARMDFNWLKNKFSQFGEACKQLFGSIFGLDFGIDSELSLGSEFGLNDLSVSALEATATASPAKSAGKTPLLSGNDPETIPEPDDSKLPRYVPAGVQPNDSDTYSGELVESPSISATSSVSSLLNNSQFGDLPSPKLQLKDLFKSSSLGTIKGSPPLEQRFDVLALNPPSKKSDAKTPNDSTDKPLKRSHSAGSHSLFKSDTPITNPALDSHKSLTPLT